MNSDSRIDMIAVILGLVIAYLGVRTVVLREDDFRGEPLSERAAIISGVIKALGGFLLLLGGLGLFSLGSR
jgi:uncharacterized membrane protein